MGEAPISKVIFIRRRINYPNHPNYHDFQTAEDCNHDSGHHDFQQHFHLKVLSGEAEAAFTENLENVAQALVAVKDNGKVTTITTIIVIVIVVIIIIIIIITTVLHGIMIMIINIILMTIMIIIIITIIVIMIITIIINIIETCMMI